MSAVFIGMYWKKNIYCEVSINPFIKTFIFHEFIEELFANVFESLLKKILKIEIIRIENPSKEEIEYGEDFYTLNHPYHKDCFLLKNKTKLKIKWLKITLSFIPSSRRFLRIIYRRTSSKNLSSDLALKKLKYIKYLTYLIVQKIAEYFLNTPEDEILEKVKNYKPINITIGEDEFIKKVSIKFFYEFYKDVKIYSPLF